MNNSTPSPRPLISVIVPVFNEEAMVASFQHELSSILDKLAYEFEIIYIDDGSRDHTLARLFELKHIDPRIAVIEFSRNFGKEIALTAGLDHAHGDAVIIIDADLQDPPALIPQLIEEWDKGFEVVYAKRQARKGESWLKKQSAHHFYRIIKSLSHIDIPEDTGDFRLLNRNAVEALKQARERHRFMKGLFSWIGFRQKAVLYRREPRRAGHSKWNYWRLWNFALEGITSFTTAPLRMATYVGLATALCAFLFGAYIIYDTLVWGNPVPGYPSLMVVVLFLGGVQLISIGIIGEYLGRLFDEAKQRPLYLLRSYSPADMTTQRNDSEQDSKNS